MNYRLGTLKDIDKIYELVEQAKYHLKEQNIDQWTQYYPIKEDFINDISKKELYIGENNGQMICIYTLNHHMEPEYFNCCWRTDSFIVLHRLCINPCFQHKGVGKTIMNHILGIIEYDSLRLDVYVGNHGAINLYHNLGFKKRGEAHWFNKDFHILEKVITR